MEAVGAPGAVAVIGPPGVGKSLFCRALSASLGERAQWLNVGERLREEGLLPAYQEDPTEAGRAALASRAQELRATACRQLLAARGAAPVLLVDGVKVGAPGARAAERAELTSQTGALLTCWQSRGADVPALEECHSRCSPPNPTPASSLLKDAQDAESLLELLEEYGWPLLQVRWHGRAAGTGGRPDARPCFTLYQSIASPKPFLASPLYHRAATCRWCCCMTA